MIPYSTDAPIYHLPFATGGLIILNIVMFIATLGYESEASVVILDSQGQEVSEAEFERLAELEEQDPEAAEELWDSYEVVPVTSGGTLLLQYGNGIRPWQWVTSIFMHDGILHLVGNMIFLWSFGLIVEGKVGWKAFLAIYFAIGVGQSGLEQIMMLGSSGGASLGASAAIFGLLGVAMMWAPRNDFECLWTYGTFEIPILAFAGLKFALEGLTVFLQGFAVSGSLLHLMGAACGLAVGAIYIKKDWVDCEGFDFFSVMAGNEGKREEREHLDREAASLMNDAYRTKVGTGAVATAAVLPARSFPPPQPFHDQSPHASKSQTTVESGNGAAEPAQMARLTYTQPVMADFDGLDDLFGGLDGGASQADPLDSVESRATAIEHAAKDRRFDEIPELLQSVRELDESYELPQDVLRKWIENLLVEKRYQTVVPLMTQHIRRFAHKRLAMRVQLAKILIHLKQPDRAIKTLDDIDRTGLSPEILASIEQLQSKAQAMAVK